MKNEVWISYHRTKQIWSSWRMGDSSFYIIQSCDLLYLIMENPPLMRRFRGSARRPKLELLSCVSYLEIAYPYQRPNLALPRALRWTRFKQRHGEVETPLTVQVLHAVLGIWNRTMIGILQQAHVRRSHPVGWMLKCAVCRHAVSCRWMEDGLRLYLSKCYLSAINFPAVTLNFPSTTWSVGQWRREAFLLGKSGCPV